MKKLNIVNGDIILLNGIMKRGQLIISNGKIEAIHEQPVEVADVELIDASGKFVSPGFIDIHIHGGGGYDFMDGTEEAFLRIAKLHAQHGTTAMLPTTLSGSAEELIQTLEAYKKATVSNTQGAQFLGMHLEGPYFAMNQRGAQDPKYIRNPDPAEYEAIIAAYPFITRWSTAPELPGALEFADYMKAHGVLPALAHTDAICEEVEKGFVHGYSLATHLYSGMAGVTRRNAYRYAGAVEAAFLIDEMDVEIIADGIHLPAPLLKLIYKIKGADRIALITDAMRAAGMPEGESILGSLNNGLKVIVEDGVAKLPDKASFAGSVATADRLVRTMKEMTGISLPEIIKMMSYTPARILGVQKTKGSLEVGKDADIVLFDGNIQVRTTIIAGNVV